MSAWRRVALEKLPEYRQIIGAAENPMALWIELTPRFEDAYVDTIKNHGVIRRFFEYARWCLESPGDGGALSDAGTAAVCAFYEHLPEQEAVRRDLYRWLSRNEFLSFREVWRKSMSEEQFREFESEFRPR